MPIIASAKKKLRADKRKQKINQKVTLLVKGSLKKFRLSPSKEALSGVYSVLDTAVKKGVIPKKRADRKKSRLATLLKDVKLPKAKTKKPTTIKKRRSRTI